MKNFYASIFFGLVGGFLGAQLAMRVQGGQASQILSSQSSSTITAENFNLVDKNGRLRAQLAMSREGSPAIFFMDTKGTARAVMGIYPPAENELPFFSLNDSSGNAAGLYRLVGEKQFPFIVLKHGGADRAIMGLTSTANESAFLVNLKPGERQVVFGKE